MSDSLSSLFIKNQQEQKSISENSQPWFFLQHFALLSVQRTWQLWLHVPVHRQGEYSTVFPNKYWIKHFSHDIQLFCVNKRQKNLFVHFWVSWYCYSDNFCNMLYLSIDKKINKLLLVMGRFVCESIFCWCTSYSTSTRTVEMHR